ncbi:hypothetical protein ASD64_07770 [Mesorhizobium sp. Root157]|uniref:hypothetical protein n=1 Tax=Mesorhizobium sp. Root157 TaxID=1736477 RepID=UPI0006FD7F94|nr:hypothetical protein [Mesorhizobium sp. Root157]KQZ82833.1 hypothetical protein ASD64_07770 [Mesorhizobium sp. Root157]
MMGAALSRWTMAFFAAALVCLLGAQTMIVLGYGFPSTAVEDPQTLVLVHMVTIGWLSLLMCGALFQFVPVLVAQPLIGAQLVLPALICLVAGLASLLAGFLQLSGDLEIGIAFLPIAGVLLPMGFGLVVVVLGRTLLSGRPLPLPARFVAAGLACLVATASIGVLFASLLSGFAPAGHAVDWRGEALPLHVTAGFGGWLTLTAIGVSYRLLPMFMLSPDKERATGTTVLWSSCAALFLVLVAVPVERMLGGPGAAWHAACLAMLVAVVLYGVDLVFFYRHRKRRNIELNSRSAIGAFAALYLSVALLVALVATGTLGQNIAALVYLVAFGWLSGLGLSQLYKIVPFLTWLECYGPVMGRKPTPRVQDLVVEKRDMPWFALYFCGVLVGTAALLAGMPDLFRLAALATLCATVALVVEMVLVRRLFNVAIAARLPEGTARPRLFLSSSR